ncbi:hypothetical protein P8605_33210 [Streptomyces sp. T-3]|nr:hypothetical protein [Streptomyces sp. T-3]
MTIHSEEPAGLQQETMQLRIPQQRGYNIPPTPSSAWAVNSRRTTWIGRALLLCLLAVQSGLALRIGGRAFPLEASALVLGYEQAEGSAGPVTDPLTGAASLYPRLAAAADDLAGLEGVRALSLLCLLGTTVVLYALTNRLFDTRAALGAAALFSVCESTVFAGRFAGGAAPGLLLLVTAAWLIARSGRAHPALVLPAAVPAALAPLLSWGTVVYLPLLTLLAALTTFPRGLARTVLRGALFAAATAALAFTAHTWFTDPGGAGLGVGGPHAGLLATVEDIGQWGGLVFLTALGGGLSYIRKGRMTEQSWTRIPVAGRVRRTLLVLTLCGAPLLAVAHTAAASSGAAEQRHLGFGLALAAPIAGVGITRMVGPHFRNPQFGIGLYVAVLVFGLVRAHNTFVPPDSARAIAALKEAVGQRGTFLADEPSVPAYYLRDRTRPSQWHSPGQDTAATAGRIGEGAYEVVILSGTPSGDRALTSALRDAGRYQLLLEDRYVSPAGPSSYRVWINK